MGKYCVLCGTEILPEQSNCSLCGALVDEGKTFTPTKKVTKNNPKLVKLLALVIFIVFAIIRNVYTPPYEAPIKYFVDGMNTSNMETLIKIFPKPMRTEITKSTMDVIWKNTIKTQKEKYGDDLKVTYRVSRKKKLKKSELDKVPPIYALLYPDDEFNITEGYEVTVILKIKGSKDKQTTKNIFYVYKVNGEWCLFDTSGK